MFASRVLRHAAPAATPAAAHAKPAKPAKPTLPAFLGAMCDVSTRLLATQGPGFGAALVRTMGFAPDAAHLDAWVARRRDSAKPDAAAAPRHHAAHAVAHTATIQAAFAATVRPASCDGSGVVHSGALATVADIWTSLHVWGLAGPATVHVSVGIDLQLCAAAPAASSTSMTTTRDLAPRASASDSADEMRRPGAGERLLCVTRVPKMGATLAFTEFQFYVVSDRAVERCLGRLAAAAAAIPDGVCTAECVPPHDGGARADVVCLRDPLDLLEPAARQSAQLAQMAMLFADFGVPFATGTHEKAFVRK